MKLETTLQPKSPKKPQKKRAPKGWEFTKEQLEIVEKLAGYGLTVELIADYFGVGQASFYEKKTPGSPLDLAISSGKSRAATFVTGKLMESIRAGNLSAIIFYCKTRLGWKDGSKIEITGEGGGAVKVEDTNKENARDLLKRVLADTLVREELEKNATS